MTLNHQQKNRIRRHLGAPDSVHWKELSTNRWALRDLGAGLRAEYSKRRGLILWACFERQQTSALPSSA